MQIIQGSVTRNCAEIATNPYGCNVVKSCIRQASRDQRLQLTSRISHDALTLVENRYGNYVCTDELLNTYIDAVTQVVQYVLDVHEDGISEGLIERFIGHVHSLSTQKFSSHVIEKVR